MHSIQAAIESSRYFKADTCRTINTFNYHVLLRAGSLINYQVYVYVLRSELFGVQIVRIECELYVTSMLSEVVMTGNIMRKRYDP